MGIKVKTGLNDRDNNARPVVKEIIKLAGKN